MVQGQTNNGGLLERINAGYGQPGSISGRKLAGMAHLGAEEGTSTTGEADYRMGEVLKTSAPSLK